MKFKIYNPDNVPVLRTTKPSIGFNQKSGTIRLNKPACDLMDLKNDSMVQLVQDEDNPGDWYLTKVRTNGFVLRSKKDPNNLVMQSTHLVRTIFKSLDFEGQSCNVNVAAEPLKQKNMDLWPLITAKLSTT